MKSEKAGIAGKKARRSLRRWVSYPALLLGIVLLLCDFQFEFYGLPRRIEDSIRDRLREKGLDVEFENIRAGVVNGIIFEELKASDHVGAVVFAQRVEADLSYSLKSGISFEALDIAGGRISVPLFPELGESGTESRIHITDIEARIRKSGNGLEISYANAFMNGFLLNTSGEIRNVFSEENYLRKNNGKAKMPALSSEAVASLVPIESRKLFAREMLAVRKKNFKSTPSLQVKLDLDLANLSAASIGANLKVPAFKLRNLPVREISGTTVLKNSVLSFRGINVLLENAESARLEGEMDLQNLSFKARASGKVTPEGIASFLDLKLPAELAFSKRPSSFSIEASDMSVSTKTGRIKAELSIPSISFRGVNFENVSLSAELSTDEKNPAVVKIEKFRAGTGENCFAEFRGAFDSKDKILSGDASGKIIPGPFTAMFAADGGGKAPFVRFSAEPVAFFAHLDRVSRKPEECAVTAQFKIPGLSAGGVDFKDFTINAAFEDGILKGRYIQASTGAGNKIRGEFDYSIDGKSGSVFISTNGKPSFTYELLEGADRAFLKSICDHFKWPEKSDSIEMNLHLRFLAGEELSYMLSGNIVVSDFLYNDTKFDYGASTFHIDSDRLTIIPRIVVQQGENHAFISLVYDNRKKMEYQPSSKLFNVPEKDSDRFHIEIESTIPGNDVLNCIIPEWKHANINLSGKTILSARALVDFNDDSASYFSAKLADAEGEWNSVPLKSIKADISYKSQSLEIKDLTASIFDGEFDMDYMYDFKKGGGNFSLSLKNAAFLPLVKCMGFKEAPSGKAGKISGNMKAEFSYGEKDALFMDGGGEIAVREADIWKIPVLQGFTKLLGASLISKDWGEISQIDCKYVLEKDRFKTDSIQTDGKAIALFASGAYCWNSGETDFRVRAKVLKNLLPFDLISRVIDPVAWIFEARLHGKGQDLEWEQISGIKSLFK